MIATTTKPLTHGLTDLINNLCAPKQRALQLIHIKNEQQYNVLMRAFELKKYKAFEITDGFQGECYIENTNCYIIYGSYDWNVTNGTYEVISFDQFIKETV